jgi:hypothetical protein
LAFVHLGLCADNRLTPQEAADGWQLLFDGKTQNGWAPRGPIKWTVRDGTLSYETGSGGGHLATQAAYANYHLKVEFWVDAVANSGVFLRCPAAGEITATNAYEVNIFDAHEKWPTGSINEVAVAALREKTAGKWNSFEITADGDHLVVRLNGKVTVDTRNSNFKSGPIAIQNLKGEGMVRFRNIKLKLIEPATR